MSSDRIGNHSHPPTPKKRDMKILDLTWRKITYGDKIYRLIDGQKHLSLSEF